MKTNIYLIRHAESTANNEGIFGGITDFNLSNNGFKQAEDLALKFENINIDGIYSSPLKRAVQTIMPTARLINKQINIVDELREIDFGEWENKLISELRTKYPAQTNYIDNTEYYKDINGQEDTYDVANRMEKAIKQISNNNINKNIIIVSHCAAIKAFLCKIKNIPFEYTKKRIEKIDNASVRKLVYNNNTFKINVML